MRQYHYNIRSHFNCSTITGNPAPSLFAKKQHLLQDIRAPTPFEIEHAPPSTFFAKPNSLLDDALPDPEGDDNVPSSSPHPLPPQSSSPFEYLPAPRAPTHQTPERQLLSKDLHPPIPSLEVGRIPSSSSPSPMKLPPSSNERLTSEPSPVRVPHPRDVARELQESLTTLLGKRQISEEDIVRPEQRKGKRPRPQPRSKVRWCYKTDINWLSILIYFTNRCHLGRNRARRSPWPGGILCRGLCRLHSLFIMMR